MKLSKNLFYAILPFLSIATGCTEDGDECKLVCGPNEVLTADCQCVMLEVDPCKDVTCETGFVCVNGDCIQEFVEVVEITKAGLLISDETWTADHIYILQGKVVVDQGITLTIEPGTLIKGAKGSGSLASALIVARGGKLMAEGTADKPIVFTAIDDNIERGQQFGTNLDETVIGQWGGLIVLGSAPISAKSGTEAQIEGIPADDTYGAYGGNDPADNSGVIKYISVRHGGALIGDGNEINGITLGGVGNSTTIENVEVVGNLDDGIEFFGGTVNLSYGLVWSQGDDGYDIDQSYSGTIDGCIYIAGAESDHALEIDGPENAANADGLFTFKNGTLIGMKGEYADWRSNAQGTVMDALFLNFSDNSDFELDNNEAVNNNYVAGKIIISGNEFILPDAVTDFSSIFKNTFEGGDDAQFKTDMTAANSAVTEGTKGADVANFAWTFAAHKGALDGL